MTFGEKLSKLRKENNYTQEQLADILGVSRQSISKWETDIAYPETDKLISMGKLFGCSMDYLLNENITDKEGAPTDSAVGFRAKIKALFRERKSKKTVWGMPLYHIGRNARGFFAIGVRARGIFTVGLLSRGIFSVGLLSLGMIALGNFSLGLLSVGCVAVGLFSAGAISIGVISFGALSVGCFSTGALAVGKYVAVGDHAYALLAIGESVAKGGVYQHIGDLSSADISSVVQWLDANVSPWLGWAKNIFKLYLC